MDKTRRSGHARLVALLALLLGLLAMHGSASAHHAAAAVPPSGAFGAAAPATLPAPADAHSHVNHQPALLAAAASVGPSLSAPECHDDCPSALGMLCVAILAGAAALSLLVQRRPQRHLEQAQPNVQPRTPVAALRRPATPDPVAELCISRT